MQTVITSKFQTTIPKKIREKLFLSVKDTLDWKMEDGRIIISPVHTNFLNYQNAIHVGPGDIREDIEAARRNRADRYK